MEHHSSQIRAQVVAAGKLLREVLCRLLPVLGVLYCFSHAAVALYLCAKLSSGYLHFAVRVPDSVFIFLYVLVALWVSFLSAGRLLVLWKGLKRPGWIVAAIGTVVVLLVLPVVAAVAILTVTAGLALEYLRTVSVRASAHLIRSCGWQEETGDNRRYLLWAVMCALICFSACGFADLSAALGYYLAWNIQMLWPWMMAGICVRKGL